MHSKWNWKYVFLLIIAMFDNWRNPLPFSHFFPILGDYFVHRLHALHVQFWLIFHICYSELKTFPFLSPRDTEWKPVSVVVFWRIRSLVLRNENIKDLRLLLNVFKISSIKARRDCAVFKRSRDMLRIETPSRRLHKLYAAGLYFEKSHFLRVWQSLPLLI